MTSFKKIALVIALLTTGIFMTATDVHAGGFKLRRARVAYKLNHFNYRVRCCYHVYKWHCGCWKLAGKYSSYKAAKFRAHQLACHGFRFNIKKILY